MQMVDTKFEFRENKWKFRCLHGLNVLYILIFISSTNNVFAWINIVQVLWEGNPKNVKNRDLHQM